MGPSYTRAVPGRGRAEVVGSVTHGPGPRRTHALSDCLFCEIAAGKRPAKNAGETTHVVAFRDNNPQAPTHVLLIPREHVADSAADLGPQHAVMLHGVVRAGREDRARRAARTGLAAGHEHRARRRGSPSTTSTSTCWAGAR